jgi:CHAD domain-containing protein
VSVHEVSERHEAVLRQLNEERAAALTRISRTLESILEQLQTIRVRIDSEPNTVSSADPDEYERLRARARQYRWYLEVQREALGLHHHGFLDRFYAVPGPLANRHDGRPSASG